MGRDDHRHRPWECTVFQSSHGRLRIIRARHIAVLLANNDESAFSQRFPSDAEKVCALLRGLKPEWSYRIYSVKDDVFPDPHAADGFVITGSPASVHDLLPWIAKLEQFVRELDERRIPLMGLCFGHQLIAKALGGQVGRNPGGWRFGIADTVFSAFAHWMQPEQPCVVLHACHAEQVLQAPPNATPLGGDCFCPIGCFAVDDHIFTTEYHPEFTSDFMTQLADAYQGELEDAVLDSGRRQLQIPVDSVLFARWMVNFFESSGRKAAL